MVVVVEMVDFVAVVDVVVVFVARTELLCNNEDQEAELSNFLSSRMQFYLLL